MSFLSRLNGVLPDGSKAKAPSLPQQISRVPSEILGFGKGVTLYPTGDYKTYIHEGYNKNAWVYSIVMKCAKKFSQVPWYHYRIKKAERKTWEEYTVLTKNQLEQKAIVEAKKMRTKAIEQVIVQSDLTKLLARPNRNESGTFFRENLYGYYLLTGEGNQWFNRPTDKTGKVDAGKPPLEMFNIPKGNVAIVKGDDPWDIAGWNLIFSGRLFQNPKDNLLMWRRPNYEFDPVTLLHLRGQSPLDAGLLLLQSSNEAAERLTVMNRNQGVAGLAYRQDSHDTPSTDQAMFQRKQFNSIVNDRDLAGSIAVMNGQWGYVQFGLDAGQLQLLEQSNVTKEGLCHIFDVPYPLFNSNETYENRKQAKREWIYDNIAVAAYALRDEWNNTLIPAFNLDRERDVIDCDIIGLPDLAEDFKTQIEAYSKAWQLSPNQILEALGEEKSTDPYMDKIYVPNNLVPMDQLNQELGSSLDNEMNLLNGQKPNNNE